MGPVPARTCLVGWSSTGQPRVVGNAPAFVDVLRWTLKVVAVTLLPAAVCPQAALVPRPTPAWGCSTSR